MSRRSELSRASLCGRPASKPRCAMPPSPQPSVARQMYKAFIDALVVETLQGLSPDRLICEEGLYCKAVGYEEANAFVASLADQQRRVLLAILLDERKRQSHVGLPCWIGSSATKVSSLRIAANAFRSTNAKVGHTAIILRAATVGSGSMARPRWHNHLPQLTGSVCDGVRCCRFVSPVLRAAGSRPKCSILPV